MEQVKEILWQQFGASIDMLRNAIGACPDALWDNGSKFWYLAYHTLFFLDFYLEEEPMKYHPPSPFTLSETDPMGKMPERTYSKDELIFYLEHGREKCRHRIFSLTEKTALAPVNTHNKEYPALEIMLYNMRHVQHHAAQLNMMIRRFGAEPPGWVSRAK